ATAAGAGLDLPRERPVAHPDHHARADAQPIALARAFQTHLQMAVLAEGRMLAQRFDPDLAAGDEIEEAVAVDVGKCRLLGGLRVHARLLRHVLEFPVAEVAIHHAPVAGIDRREVEIDQPVVVHVAGYRDGVALLPAQLDRFASVLEAEFFRAGIAQELRAVLPYRRMREIGDEDIEVRIVIEVRHATANRVAATANGRAGAVAGL